jgi:hypothetical protein
MLTNNTQLDKYTTPCPNKATDSLLSSSKLNTELMDTRCDPKQQSLKMTTSESDNSIKSDNVLSPTQENLATDRTTAQASENIDVTQVSNQTLDDASTLADLERHVTAVVAKVKYEATES